MELSIDWNKEIQDLTEDILMEALTIDLCRLAAAQHAPILSRYPREIIQDLLFRCGDHLAQRAADLETWGQVLAAPETVSTILPTSPG